MNNRKASARASVENFERGMQLLAETEAGDRGRWIIVPRKGARFIGPRARAHARARDRRRRVIAFLLESLGLTFLIGMVPPLRPVWFASGVLFAVLALYVWLLISFQQQSPQMRARERAAAAAVPASAPRRRAQVAREARERFVAESRHARATLNGLGALTENDLANIVVRPAREVGVAGA